MIMEQVPTLERSDFCTKLTSLHQLEKAIAKVVGLKCNKYNPEIEITMEPMDGNLPSLINST